jgi:hypothetical protein
MNVELSEEDLPLIRRALEHYHAYTCAVQREDGRYKMLAERLSAPQRKPAAPEKAKSFPARAKKRAS